jgi:hypothetical protein
MMGHGVDRPWPSSCCAPWLASTRYLDGHHRESLSLRRHRLWRTFQKVKAGLANPHCDAQLQGRCRESPARIFANSFAKAVWEGFLAADLTFMKVIDGRERACIRAKSPPCSQYQLTELSWNRRNTSQNSRRTRRRTSIPFCSPHAQNAPLHMCGVAAYLIEKHQPSFVANAHTASPHDHS